MGVALINTNSMKPPIAPIGLEYVAETLAKTGHRIEILDLCWEPDTESAISSFFKRKTFDLVGITLRNTDDCAFTSRKSFINSFVRIVNSVCDKTDAVVVLGGAGFSTMPEQILEYCKADAGVWGDGEVCFRELAGRIEKKQDWSDLPNLIVRQGSNWVRNPLSAQLPAELPAMDRDQFNNVRYFNEGGQAGFETKIGCPEKCVYCADPVAKGNRTRVRSPKSVAHELKKLLSQGIDHMHTCDSEFNIPEWHAKDVCREIISAGLGNRLQWYAYCSPVPFSRELAGLMSTAGCAGINFGVDSGDAGILKRLNRNFTPEDILTAARFCKESGIAVMFDLLIGSPGETKESVTGTIELTKRSKADVIGINTGVRVYPGTMLKVQVESPDLKQGLVKGEGPADPVFFIDTGVRDCIFDLLDSLIGDNRRFFFFDPSKPERNYNYNSNKILIDAIQKGYRGAYWDILRRYVS
jgi:radical SAM superfamily enzyme YgiQ (UPF0313 family)